MEENQTPELSEVEKQAMELGWKPKDQFDESTGKKWRSAEEFMDRQPLYETIESLKKQVKRQETAVENLVRHNAQVEKAAYERAVRELKAARAAAIEDGDMKKAEALRDQLEDTKAAAAQVQVPTGPDPVFVEWKERNDWYQEDDVLTNYADGLGNKLAAKGLHPHDIFKEVERQVREKFPTKFRNPNKDAAPPVEPSKKSATTKISAVEAGMSEEDRKIMANILRVGGLTKEEYLRQYASYNQKN